MSKQKKLILITFTVILGISIAIVLGFASINPHKDVTKDLNYPPEFFCDNNENHIDYQTDGNCAAYALAYVLRNLGEHTDGEMIVPKIRRVFGFVPPRSIVRVFEQYGFSSKAYHGDIATLKWRLSSGVPIIVFISIPNDTHYAVVVGYDKQYFYLVDSLLENKNINENWYNRKLTNDEFENIWRTNTLFSNNIYIVAF